MKIAIIGGGASGVYASILLKRKYKEAEVIIYEASDKLLTKVKASGNGRCNIDNLKDNPNVYNDPFYMQECFKRVPIEKQLETLKSFGIYTKELMANYLYPISESALNVKILLEKCLEKEGVKVIFNKRLVDYSYSKNGYVINFEDGKSDNVDRIVFAYGSVASSKNTNIKSLENVFLSKGYKICDNGSGLVPIKVKENVKNLFGQRIKCNVKAIFNKNVIFDEDGEVLFKKDGLSGIVIFNLSSVISRGKYKDVTIKLTILDNTNMKILKTTYAKNKNVDILYSFFGNSLVKYILDRSKKENISPLDLVDNFTFKYVENYPLDAAQIRLGGIQIENFDVNMMSKIEKNVYFIGEACNIDGYCGGFNLKWALISAILLSENFR